MRAIFVTPLVSADPRSGGEIRTHRLVSALARRVETTLVVVGNVVGREALQDSTGVAELHIYPRLGSPWKKRGVAVARRWPLAAARVWHPDVARLLSSRPHDDLVVLDHLRTAGYRPAWGPYVLALQNHDSRLVREAALPRSPLRAAEHIWEKWATRALERACVRDPRALVLAVSEVDAAALGPRVEVIPNGTDVPDAIEPRRPGGSLLFVGSLDYAPNRDAIAWWIEEISPHLPPGAGPLRVVGRGGAPALGQLATHPSLDVVGEVDDISAELANAAIAVIPLRSGSGTRLKLLEALAWGRPVVSTAKGAEGIPVVDGTHVLIADDGAAFARCVATLRSDAPRAERLAAAGREFVQNYSWERIGDQFADAVQRART